MKRIEDAYRKGRFSFLEDRLEELLDKTVSSLRTSEWSELMSYKNEVESYYQELLEATRDDIDSVLVRTGEQVLSWKRRIHEREEALQMRLEETLNKASDGLEKSISFRPEAVEQPLEEAKRLSDILQEGSAKDELRKMKREFLFRKQVYEAQKKGRKAIVRRLYSLQARQKRIFRWGSDRRVRHDQEEFVSLYDYCKEEISPEERQSFQKSIEAYQQEVSRRDRHSQERCSEAEQGSWKSKKKVFVQEKVALVNHSQKEGKERSFWRNLAYAGLFTTMFSVGVAGYFRREASIASDRLLMIKEWFRQESSYEQDRREALLDQWYDEQNTVLMDYVREEERDDAFSVSN